MYQRILIPTDGSTCSESAVRRGAELAEKFGGNVTILHVLENHYLPASDPKMARQTEGMNAEVEEYANDILFRARDIAIEHGLAPEVISDVDDHPEEVILNMADAHDLVVMGSHGRSGLGRIMFGSVSQRVLHKAPCPVLIIPCRE